MVDHMQQQVEKEKTRLGAMVEHLRFSEEKKQMLLHSITFPKSKVKRRTQSPEDDTQYTNMTRSCHNKEEERPPFTYATLIRQVIVFFIR